MASLIEQLDAVDLSALTQKLEAARRTVGVDGLAAVRGLDPRDLLGELGGLLKSDNPFGIDPAQLTHSVSAGLGKLDGLIQLPHLPLFGDVLGGLERLVGLLEDALSKFGGSGEIDLDRLLPEIAGLDGFFDEVLGRVFDVVQPQVPGELTGVLSALKTLASRNPADARELATLLAPFVLGLSFEHIDAVSGRLTATVGRINAAGGDLQPIQAEIRRLASAARDAARGLDAPDIAVGDVEARIAQIRGDVGLLLRNTVPGAAARLAQELDAIDGSGLALEMRTAVEPLLAASAAPPFRLDVDLLQPVRALAENIDRLTADDLAKHFATVEAEMVGVAESAGLTQLTKAVDELFDIVIHTMREVPIRRMRQDLIDELNVIEARIRDFEGFDVPRVIADKVAGIDQRIDTIDLSAIRDRVGAFAQQLQAVVDQFPVNDIRNGAEQASQALGDLMGDFTDALAALSNEVDALADRLKDVDFRQAGEAAIALIADARGKVEDVLSSDDVPDVAKAGIGAAASTLKGFDFSIEISAPFNQTLDAIDVSVVTAPLDAVTGRVRGTLEKVAPTALVAELEMPFERLLKDVERFRADAIRAGLSQEFQRLTSALDVLKPERLVAPLEAQFTTLTDALRKAVDPAPLFAPLHALYRRLIELVDLLDLEKLLGRIAGKTSQIPQLLGGKMQDVLTQRVGGAEAAPNTDATDALFQWGDFIRPLAAIAQQLRARIEKLSSAIVGQALDLIEAPLRGLVALADAGSGFLAQVADAVEARYRSLDVFATGGAGEDLLVALHELDAAVASAGIGGDAGVRLDGHLAAIRGDLDATAALDLGRESTLRAAEVAGRLDGPDLAHSLRRVGTHLRSLIPAGGLAGEVNAAVGARLDALFGTIDFAGIATELDTLGARIRTKLEGFAKQIAAAILRLVDRAFQAVLPITPFGMLGRISQGMARVRAEFTVFDPAVLEKEVRDLVDALVDGLEMFSPAHLASQLNGLTDGVLRKLRELDPATLLGDLAMIDGVIDTFAALRPSVVLAPLVASTEDLTRTLDAILAIDLGASLRAAIEALREELEAVVAQVQAEFTALIGFLEEQGGGASASVSF